MKDQNVIHCAWCGKEIQGNKTWLSKNTYICHCCASGKNDQMGGQMSSYTRIK